MATPKVKVPFKYRTEKYNRRSRTPNGLFGPPLYTPELADLVCERLAKGDSLLRMCQELDMPNRSVIHSWIADNVDGFQAKYARAKHVAVMNLADEILEFSDNPLPSVRREERSDGSYKELHEDGIERARLKVASRQWLLSKLLPKKFGDAHRLEVTGDGGGPVEITDSERISKLTAILALANHRKEQEEKEAENKEQMAQAGELSASDDQHPA